MITKFLILTLFCPAESCRRRKTYPVTTEAMILETTLPEFGKFMFFLVKDRHNLDTTKDPTASLIEPTTEEAVTPKTLSKTTTKSTDSSPTITPKTISSTKGSHIRNMN